MDFVIKLIPERIRKIPTHMDFDGQKRAEKWFQCIILVFGVVGFVWGYICQQFSQTMYILIAGFVISCCLTLPPWPMFRRKPLNWQKIKQEPENDTSNSSSQAVSQKSRKRK